MAVSMGNKFHVPSSEFMYANELESFNGFLRYS